MQQRDRMEVERLEQSGEYLIEGPRGDVWAALNDAEILKDCIDGAQSVKQASDGVFNAVVAVANAGSSGSVFETELSMSALDKPDHYQISVNAQDVKGLDAGVVSGVAQLKLASADAATRLDYSLQADLGGELSRLNPGVVESAARQMADNFFARFAAENARLLALKGEGGSEPRLAETETAAEVPYEPSRQWVIWAIMFGVLLLAVLLTF